MPGKGTTNAIFNTCQLQGKFDAAKYSLYIPVCYMPF